MSAYQYDATLEGLLTAFQIALRADSPEPLFLADLPGRPPSLLAGETVHPSPPVAAELWRQIESCGGRETLRHVLYSLLSEAEAFESPLFHVVRLTLRQRAPVLDRHTHPHVRAVREWTRKVAFEAHRLAGLLRFIELRDGALYAPCEPDHHVTLLLARHFARRLATEKWVIHDRRRAIAVAWNGHQILPVDQMPEHPENLITDDEQAWQALWQRFFRAVAIPERQNPLLQRRFMPRRYWKYLPEKQAD